MATSGLSYDNHSSPSGFALGIGMVINDWASEASPTLGCSIEISREICICYSTGRSDIRDIFHEL